MSVRVPEDNLRSLCTAGHFNGFPLINAATDGTICLADKACRPRYLVPPSGQIVRVPQHQLKWRSLDNGLMVTDIEYGVPEDLPDAAMVAIITMQSYYDLHVWNSNCGIYEKVDLSWMVVLGERITTPLGFGLGGSVRPSETICGYYRGLIIPPEAKSNRQLLPRGFHECSRAQIARSMIPEIPEI